MIRFGIFFMRSLLCILLFPFTGIAQEIIKGKIIDSSTGNAIPYATVGLAKQNTGTNANEQGEFTISCQQPEIDTLIISCVGYVTNRASVKDFRANPILILILNIKRLKPVVIKNKWAFSEVGTSKKTLAYGLTSTGSQSQAATKLTAPFTNTFLQTLNIRTSKYGGEGKFRVHVFDFDSVSKGPGDELTDTVIEVNSKPGITTIDMLPYQISIPGKDFFVSVEWLRIPFNAKISTALYEGKNTEQLTYSPHVCFTKEPQSSSDEIWGLAYSGRWYPMTDKKYFPNSLAISATLKY